MIKRLLIRIINIYQKRISPLLGHNCKYNPSCSEYTKQAIEKYGCMRGCLKGFIRIIRCNPFSKGGYDPLK